MNIKTNSLSQCRRAENISLQDIAYLLNMDIGNLSKVESGERDANLKIILLYHILFEAPVTDLFSEQLHALKSQIRLRSQELITKLQELQTSKSKHRITYLHSLVNSLNSNYDNSK